MTLNKISGNNNTKYLLTALVKWGCFHYPGLFTEKRMAVWSCASFHMRVCRFRCVVSFHGAEIIQAVLSGLGELAVFQ